MGFELSAVCVAVELGAIQDLLRETEREREI